MFIYSLTHTHTHTHTHANAHNARTSTYTLTHKHTKTNTTWLTSYQLCWNERRPEKYDKSMTAHTHMPNVTAINPLPHSVLDRQQQNLHTLKV